MAHSAEYGFSDSEAGKTVCFTKAYLKPCQISMMEVFPLQPLKEYTLEVSSSMKFNAHDVQTVQQYLYLFFIRFI